VPGGVLLHYFLHDLQLFARTWFVFYFFLKTRPFCRAQPSKDKHTHKMQNLKDKVGVVFAASGEIAGAVARSFSQHGAKVYVTARDLDAVKALAQEIKASGGRAEAAKVDALNETEIDNFLKKVVEDNGKLDVVFNGIAVAYSEMGGRPPAMVATFEQFMAQVQKSCG